MKYRYISEIHKDINEYLIAIRDPQLHKSLSKIPTITDPDKLYKEILAAIDFIKKNKNVGYPTKQLKSDLKEMLQYCEVRKKYSNVFDVAKGLNELSKLELNEEVQMKLYKISAQLKKVININGVEESLQFQKIWKQVEKLVNELKQSDELKPDSVLVNSSEICEIVDELDHIGQYYFEQIKLSNKQEKIMKKLKEFISDYNDYAQKWLSEDIIDFKIKEEKEIQENKNSIQGKFDLVEKKKDALAFLFKERIMAFFESPTVIAQMVEDLKIDSQNDKVKLEVEKIIKEVVEKLPDYAVRDKVSTYTSRAINGDNPEQVVSWVLDNVIRIPIQKKADAGGLDMPIGIQKMEDYFKNEKFNQQCVSLCKDMLQIHKEAKKLIEENNKKRDMQDFRKRVFQICRDLSLETIVRVYAEHDQLKKEIAGAELSAGKNIKLPVIKHANKDKAISVEALKAKKKREELLNEFLSLDPIAEALTVATKRGVNIDVLATCLKHNATIISNFNQGDEPLIANDPGHCAGIALEFAKEMGKSPNTTVKDLQERYSSQDIFHRTTIGLSGISHSYQVNQNQKKLKAQETKTILHQKDVTGKKTKHHYPQSIGGYVLTNLAPKENSVPLASSINQRVNQLLKASNTSSNLYVIGIYSKSKEGSSKLQKYFDLNKSGHALMLATLKDGCAFLDANGGIFHFKDDGKNSGMQKFQNWFEDYHRVMYEDHLDAYYNVYDVSVEKANELSRTLSSIESFRSPAADMSNENDERPVKFRK